MKYPLSENQIFKFRPMPFYFITTSDDAQLTVEKTEEDLQKLKACGFGGFVLFNKAYTEENYLKYFNKRLHSSSLRRSYDIACFNGKGHFH